MQSPAPQGESTAGEAEKPAVAAPPKPDEAAPGADEGAKGRTAAAKARGTDRPKRKKKRRKQRKQPPGWHREDRIEGPDPRIPKKVVTEDRPSSLLPPDPPTPEAPRREARANPEEAPGEARAVPEERPAPAKDLAESPAPVEPAAPPRADATAQGGESAPAVGPEDGSGDAAASEGTARPSPRQRDQATLAWIVVPKLEALLEEVDQTLADPEASRDALVTARSRFVREWRALQPIPPSEIGRLGAAHDTRLAEVTRRIDATVDPRVEEEKTRIAMRETMIEAAAGLVELPDLKAAIQQAKALQREWRDAPRVDRDVAKDQNVRFRAAMDAVFARREHEDAERLVKLEAFVDSAEALSRSEDPERAAEAMKRLQQQWKATGGVRGEKGDEVWTRFRAAADAVFERRRLEREEMHARSLAARQALIDEANERADEGVEDADHTIRDLQRRWRQTGHVPRESADQLWTSFKEACDRIRNPPAMDPTALGDGQEGLSFNPFAGIEGADQDS